MSKVRFISMFMLLTVLLSTSPSVTVGQSISQSDTPLPVPAGTQAEEPSVYENDVLGVTLSYPGECQIIENQYLSDVYGFSVVDLERTPIFQVGWVHKASPKQQNQFVEETLTGYSSLPVNRASVQVGGQTGEMLSPVPGVVANTLIYVSANERLYEIRYYKESLDDLGRFFLENVRFYPACQSLDELQLFHADDVLFTTPELEERLLEEELETDGPEKLPLPDLSMGEPSGFESIPSGAQILSSVEPGCTTYSLVQTQWGSGANDTGQSTAGPYFFGEGTHQGCDDDWSYNDHYALDHPLDEWDLIYPHRSGTVIFSDWAGGGWKTLGRMVVIDYGGGSWGVMAHLRYISYRAEVGKQVDENTIIGYAGGSGDYRDDYWGVHLHQSVNKDAKLSTNPGGIYDGQSARPIGYQYSGNGGGTYWHWDLWSGMPMSY